MARLTVTGATKDYAVRVLDDVDFELRAGEIHALVGSNGAGKSTLCNIISGLIPATAGSMTLDGKIYSPGNKQAAESRGVQTVQQELNLIPTLTVAENIMFGRMPNRGGVIRRQQLKQRARIALDRFGLADVDVDTITAALGVGKQQMVEIASALDRDCRVLILDEPTAALSAGETDRLFHCLDQLRKRGVGIIYVSHRLDEVSRMADRITTLRDGRRVATHQASELSTDQMVQWMSGEIAITASRSHHDLSTEKIRLRVSNLTREDVLDHVSFELREGERLGIAGLVGSGRTELLRAILGADVADGGSVSVNGGRPRRFRHPRQAVRSGIAMVTEDRKQNGLLLPESIRTNLTLCQMSRFATAGLIWSAQERRVADQMRDEMEIRCTHTDQVVATLSGGNQQKVAVGKWLVRDSDIYLFDEPTRGIDVVARARIYRLFDTLAKQGKSIVIVSSDVDELLETCDRVMVMSAGRVVDSFDRGNWSREAILQASFAGYLDTPTATSGSTAEAG